MNPENSNFTQSSTHLLNGRLKDLSDNISRNYDLLKDYEKTLLFEDDPKRIARYKNEIENIRNTAAKYEIEYEELKGKISQVLPKTETSTWELSAIKNKLDVLLQGQSNIKQTLAVMQEAILSHYDESEKQIVCEITSKISQSQAKSVKEILEAVDRNQLTESEMNDLVSSAQNILDETEKKGNISIPEKETLKEVINSQISSKNKFKLVVPIIPTILNYETELELPVDAAIKKLWNKLVERFKGEEMISIFPQD